MDEKINRVIRSLKANNMNGYYARNKKEVLDYLDRMIPDGSTVGSGGSVTLDQLGILDYIRGRKVTFYDRYAEGLTSSEKHEIHLKCFTAGVYLTGSNAITENGELINIDGNGNRVAAMIYGPEKVIVVAGINKITSNAAEGIERARQTAAPLNSKRLNKSTPCVLTGKCSDCRSKQRICNAFVTISGQFDPDRIHVILVDDDLGL